MTPGQIPRAEIDTRLRWAVSALRARGLSVDRPMGAIHKAWSVIVPIRTGEGAVFLKYVRGAFLHEPGLTRELHDLAPDYVPELLAEDPDLGCWITRDAGDEIALRDAVTAGHVTRLLSRHATLQQATAGAAQHWLGSGAKDLRTGRWPGYLEDIRSNTTALDLDKVSQPVLRGLGTAGPAFDRLCDRLAALNVPETVTHMDLRRINVKIRRGRVTVIDWGDAGYGPAFLDPVPLFSELDSLRLSSDTMRTLHDAAASPWTDRMDTAAIHEARRLCRIAFPLLYAHGLIHARPSWDPTLTPSYHGLLQFYLSTFLDRLSAPSDSPGRPTDS